jgi:hypothetical protein
VGVGRGGNSGERQQAQQGQYGRRASGSTGHPENSRSNLESCRAKVNGVGPGVSPQALDRSPA